MQPRLVQELQTRGYFRKALDLCVSLLPWFAVTLSLRHVGVSAVGAWMMLLFITCLEVREASPGPGHQERQSACMEIAFVSVPCYKQSKLQQSSRWGGVCELLLARLSPHRAACAQVSPRPGSWGSSCLSCAKSLNHLSYRLGKQTGWKHAILPPGTLIPATCLEMDFLPHGLLMSGLLSTGRALGLYSLCLTCIISFCS